MGLSQLFEISLVNVSWSNLGLARPWRCIVRFLLLPESCRRVGSARSLVGGASETKSLFQSTMNDAERLSPGSWQGGEVAGRASWGTGSGEQLRLELSPSLERTNRIICCPAPPCGECLFFMLERPALESEAENAQASW